MQVLSDFWIRKAYQTGVPQLSTSRSWSSKITGSFPLGVEQDWICISGCWFFLMVCVFEAIRTRRHVEIPQMETVSKRHTAGG